MHEKDERNETPKADEGPAPTQKPGEPRAASPQESPPTPAPIAPRIATPLPPAPDFDADPDTSYDSMDSLFQPAPRERASDRPRAPAKAIPPPTPVPAEVTDAEQSADIEREPATWRSKSKPPVAGQEPMLIKPPLDTRRRGQRASSSRDLAPDLDADSDLDADIAPIGPTEAASSRPGATSIREPVATPRGPAPSPSAEEIEHQIQDLEARLDRMIRQSRQSRAEAAPPPPPPAPSRPVRLPDESREEPDESSVTARELLSTDFYLRQWGRIGMRNRSEEVDEFGLDPKYEARYRPFFDFLYKYYFRVDTEGTENIPAEDRCLIVSNHSGGALPYDGIMLRTTVRLEHPQARELRWLAEDFIYYLPFVGAVMNRIGAVRACQENAERLLASGRLVAVFPEGAKGTGKLYRERYKLQRFGRGGFIRLCLRTQTPLVPCAIIGAEEANPMLYRIEYMTKSLGIPYIPITPTFPALGPLGLLPAPTKWKIRFGEPISFDGYGPEAADDDILVGRLAERVRSTIQGLIDKSLGSRRSIWFG
ncbi:MAG: 1-acyl-sn-glycerol-3-phosphate acyltransferase [Polyangiaceae bacterium]|nr:1-acyl-sn-glycerol-3-phosphate acyltransferase [Polyangiaceae bacterium]